MQILIELNAHCRRVLGALLEKEQTTPDYYPLTLNALISACNQTSNRNPVMSLKRYEVLAALHEMERHNLVQRVTGPRADRWSHTLIQRLVSEPANKAILTVLMLRGAQTIGELKGRTERMYAFSALNEVEEILEQLAGTEPPLVREVVKKPGQKENRWELSLIQDEAEEVVVVETLEHEANDSSDPSLVERVERLEKKLDEVLERLRSLECE